MPPRKRVDSCTLEPGETAPGSPLWRDAFLRQIGPTTPIYQLFEHLPDIAFFAKDAEFRISCASRLFFERFGFQSESEILGKDDFELFPSRLAETFRRDDEVVLRSGEPRINLVELFFNRQGIPDWFVTNKLPLRDLNGQIIGLMGTTHSYEARKAMLQPFLNLDKAVDFIRAHFRERISVEALARAVHLSPRQLQRKFIEAFGVGPQAFGLKMRIQAACEALQIGTQQIAEVGKSMGFCDQSAFTKTFHQHIGLTPRQYQLQFRLRRKLV